MTTPPRGVPKTRWEQLTPFQRAVYRATARIPKGQTRSYAWIARQIGKPRAARAVGQALRRNPFAPRIPCHRVVGADGELTGYAGGLATKRALLRAERRVRCRGFDASGILTRVA